MEMKQAFNKMFGTELKVKFRLPTLNCKKVLIVAPHPDDETLGCGATAQLLCKNGCQVSVVLLTDGRDRGLAKDISQLRLNEFNNAIRLLGCRKANFLGLPDGRLNIYMSNAIIELTGILESERPDIIFLPYALDFNSDHKYANLILARSLDNINDVYIAMYEIWTPIIYPNCYVDVTKEYDVKLSAINCYVSQEEHYKIRDKAKSLNGFRAEISMRRNVKYIEAFKVFRNEDFDSVIKMLEFNCWFKNRTKE